MKKISIIIALGSLALIVVGILGFYNLKLSGINLLGSVVVGSVGLINVILYYKKNQ